MKPLQVFEYERLQVGDRFTEDHLEALAMYNDEHGGGFFKLNYKGVQFQQYVGVIQVGDLTIEILPKVGKESAPGTNPDKWQKVLLDMLQECNWMTVHANEKANLQFKFNSLLEAYLELFIRECESLLQLGLIKKYRHEDSNTSALKGKLLFSKNIQHNIVHQERFYTRHQAYDRNNLFNQILYSALKLIPTLANNPFLTDRVYSLLLAFPETDTIRAVPATFSNLIFDRKSSAYEEAIGIAAMILLNYRPDIKTGTNNVLAILFDMNDLWEEYVYRQIFKHSGINIQIEPQQYKKIWEKENTNNTYKGIKPDILLHYGTKTLIIDTKWKLPEDDIPADADLKQMFMYNEYWSNANALLLYPKETFGIVYDAGKFLSGGRVAEAVNNTRHKCGILKTSVLNANNEVEQILDEDLGGRILQLLIDQELL
jgi:5-methylcytosine-specific restriction enzyme subunit McrC